MEHHIAVNGGQLAPDIHAVHNLGISLDGDFCTGTQDTLGAAVDIGRGINIDGASVYSTGNCRIGNIVFARLDPADQIAHGNLGPNLAIGDGTVNDGEFRVLGQLGNNGGAGIGRRVNIQSAGYLDNGIHGYIGIGGNGLASFGAGTGILQRAVIQLDVIAVDPACAGDMVPLAALLGYGNPGIHRDGGDQLTGDLRLAADIDRFGAVDDGGVGFGSGRIAGAAGIQNNILQADPALQAVLVNTAPAVLHLVKRDLGAVFQGTDLVGYGDLGGRTDIQVNITGNRTGRNGGTAGGAAAQACQGDIGQIHIQLVLGRGEAILGIVSFLNHAPLEVLAIGILHVGFVESDRGVLGDGAGLGRGSRRGLTDLDALRGNNLTGIDHRAGVLHRQRTGADDLHQGNRGRRGGQIRVDPLVLIGLDLHPAVRILLVDIDGRVVRQGIELRAVGAGAQANLHGNAALDGADILQAGVGGGSGHAAGIQLDAGSLDIISISTRAQAGVGKGAPLIAVDEGAGGRKLKALGQQVSRAARSGHLGVDRGQIILDPSGVGNRSSLSGGPGLYVTADLAGALLRAVGTGGGILSNLPVVEAVGRHFVGACNDMGQGAAVNITGLVGVAVSGAGGRLDMIHPNVSRFFGGITEITDVRVNLADPDITADRAFERDLFIVAFRVDLDIIAAGGIQVNGLCHGNGGVAAKTAFVGLGLTMLTGACHCFVGDLFHVGGKARVCIGRIVVIVSLRFRCKRCHRHDGSHHGNDQQPGDDTNQAFLHFLFPPLVFTRSLNTVSLPGAQLQRLPPVDPEAESILT